LEDFDGAVGNVMVEIPSHILDDDDEEEEEIEMDIELAKVNMAYVVDPASQTQYHRKPRHETSLHLHQRIEDDIYGHEADPSQGEKTRSGRRSDGRSPGKRLHKTRSHGKVKLLDAETAALPHPSHPQRFVESQAASSGNSSSTASGRTGNRNLAYHASPTDQLTHGETPC